MSSSLSFDSRACLVAGSAKSGTTLLVSLLDGHPQLLPFPEETAYFPTARRKFLKKGRAAQVKYLMEESEARLLFAEVALPGNRDYSGFPRAEFRRRFESAAGSCENSGRDLLAILMACYGDTLGIDLGSVVRWIEKTPANRYCLPDIRAQYPDAKVILTMRDPRAILSAFLERERKKRTGSLSVYLCAANWLQSAKLALNARPGDPRLIVVRYEELLRDPEPQLRRICEFLEIAFDPILMRPTKAGAAWSGNSTGGKKFSGIDASPVDRWRGVLSEKEIGWIEFHCRDWMTALGYAPLSEKRNVAHWFRRFPEESLREYVKARRTSLWHHWRGTWRMEEQAASLGIAPSSDSSFDRPNANS